tara:strand:- start:4282 stop:4539 length:258 start_codon:yes stop_codon:yes gene_type:complete
MAKETWRDLAKATITEAKTDARVIKLVEEGKFDEARKFVSLKFYPFTMRNYYPYQVWLDELKKQFAPPPPEYCEYDPNQLTMKLE